MVSKAEVTPWFDALAFRPYRDGWYEIRYAGSYSSVMRREFRNGNWMYSTPDGAEHVGSLGQMFGDQWRGLTKPAGK